MRVSQYAAGCTGLYAIVAVKAYQTRGALEALGFTRAPVVVVVQNGFGGLEAVEASAGERVVAGGVAELGATRAGWRVELRGPGRLYVGCRRRPCASYLAGLAQALEPPVKVEIVDDIEPWRWLKAAVNAAINLITAALGVPNGRLAEDDRLWNWAMEIVGEVEEAARLRGVEMPVDPASYLSDIIKTTGENKSSTLQDLESCRRTEVPQILGPALATLGPRATALRRALRAFQAALRSRCGSGLLG